MLPGAMLGSGESARNHRDRPGAHYDNITKVYGGQDHTLDAHSLHTLREVFADPYWILVRQE